EDALVVLGREDDGDLPGPIVRGEAYEGSERGPGGRRAETVEAGLGEGPRELPGAVGAEVEEDDGVAVPDCPGVADHRRRQELVGNTPGVARLDRRGGAFEARPLALYEGAKRQLRPLPAIVPVHGVVASRHAGDGAPGALLQEGLQPADVAEAARGERVAPVEERMDEDPSNAALPGEPDEGLQMADVAVDSAVAQ